MISRIWHGRVPTAKAKEYRDFLNTRAIPDYQSVEGNVGVYILEQPEGEVTHFITLSFWGSDEVIRGFAGQDAGFIRKTRIFCWNLGQEWHIMKS